VWTASTGVYPLVIAANGNVTATLNVNGAVINTNVGLINGNSGAQTIILNEGFNQITLLPTNGAYSGVAVGGLTFN
jgi:hypothetical protein